MTTNFYRRRYGLSELTVLTSNEFMNIQVSLAETFYNIMRDVYTSGLNFLSRQYFIEISSAPPRNVTRQY